MSAFFITATGTDIGKTFITAGLVRYLRARGEKVSALKPVVSGFEPNAAEASDSGVLLRALGEPITPASLDRISPWRFRAPLSPDMAAARQGRTIGFDELVTFCRKAAQASHTVFIEGVGGVMVPLDGQRTVIDWIAELGAPAILLAGTYLGTISHTLTACDVLARRRIALRALVLNESGDGAVPVGETKSTLARHLPGMPIAIVPRVASPGDAPNAFAALWQTVANGK